MDKVLYKLMVLDKKGFSFGLKGNLSFLDIYIIKEIGKKNKNSIYNIVKETDIDRRIVTTIVGKLASNGYLVKERSEKDKRVQRVKLTDLGNEIYERAIEAQREIMDFVLNDITLNEEKAVLKFLSKLNQTMI